MPAILHRLSTLCYCHFFDRKVMCFFRGQLTSTYGCCNATCSSWYTTTVLASKIARSFANWTHKGHDEVRTYSFSRACHNHCQIATMGARHMGQSITEWHSAPLWQNACENTHFHCHQTGLHSVLLWLFGHPLLWHVSFDLNLSYKLPVTSTCNTMDLSLRMLHFFFPAVYFCSDN